MESGIYFDLPEDEYHAAPAFGSSSIKNAAVSALTCWHSSPFNPDKREFKASAAMERGTAYHKRVLEGPEAFDRAYALEPDRADYPDALGSKDDLIDLCKAMDLKTTGTIPVLLERLRGENIEVSFWPEIKSALGEKSAGKKFISRELWEEILGRLLLLNQDEDLTALLEGGYPEVSLFWTDGRTGVPLKARVDMLHPNMAVDLKTLSNPGNLPFSQAVARSAAKYRHHVQAVLYLQGIKAVKRMGDEGVARGEHDPAWLERFRDMDADYKRDPSFVGLYLEAGPVANMTSRVFRPYHLSVDGKDRVPNLYWTAAEDSIAAALGDIAGWKERYGLDQPWSERCPGRCFNDDDFPLWTLD